VSDEFQELDGMLGFLGEDGRDRRDPEEHPSPEELSAYQANELAPKEDERIQEHLAVCQHCTELLLDLEEFLRPPVVAAEPVASFEEAADWRRDHLPPPPQTASRKPLRYLFAASLAGALILSGLFSWRATRLQREVTELRSQVAELRQPFVNPPVISLRSVRGEAFELPANRPVQLNLETSAPEEYAEYQVQIMDSEDKPVWKSTLHKGEHGKLTMILPKNFLKPGSYTFRLVGVHGGSLDVLEEYLARVASNSSGSQER
jgi:hypothetical protein